jgi:UDP-N-acetyl-D-mannosaminuronate dehydrogenase
MAATEEDARAVAETANTAFIRIIFNETNFEYMPPESLSEDQFILVVRPALAGHYHVWQISAVAGVMSPFANQQTLTAQSLAFDISVVLESATYLKTGEEVQNIVEKRAALIRQLCTSPSKSTLVASARGDFVDATAS